MNAPANLRGRTLAHATEAQRDSYLAWLSRLEPKSQRFAAVITSWTAWAQADGEPNFYEGANARL